jgi:two-component system response regulator PilR (NtrC family)
MNKILIVDDHELIRSLLYEHLSAYFACSTAPSVAEAKILLATRSFKVVLTDINMPGGSGFELLAHIKQTHPEIVVVMISTDGPAAAYALTQGAFEFVQKPFDLSQVRSVIERALNHYWARAGLDQTPDDP